MEYEWRYDKNIPMKTIWMYLMLLIVDIAVSIVAVFDDRVAMLVITVPIGIVVAVTLFTDRKIVHIPPVLVLALCVTMIVSLIPARYGENTVAEFLSNFMLGMCLMMIGMIFAFLVLALPHEELEEHRLLLYTLSFGFSMTVLLIIIIARCCMNLESSFDAIYIVRECGFIILGSAAVMVLSELGLSRYIFDSRLNKILEDRYGMNYTDEEVLEDSKKMIIAGESERLEFKSTLVTNLMTGQKDPRMEKAVLKTINAFLNTKGGTLMIGVSDDGSICGVDEKAFESRDKMSLHLTHIISSRIGDEFFAYISFRIIDVEEGKAIIRVNCEKCKKPVFLIDGKEEQYYVRSGPSSVELKGHDLVNYIKNRSDKNRKKILGSLVMEEE